MITIVLVLDDVVVVVVVMVVMSLTMEKYCQPNNRVTRDVVGVDDTDDGGDLNLKMKLILAVITIFVIASIGRWSKIGRGCDGDGSVDKDAGGCDNDGNGNDGWSRWC